MTRSSRRWFAAVLPFVVLLAEARASGVPDDPSRIIRADARGWTIQPNANVTLTGKVSDASGNGLYSAVLAYRSSDRVVVSPRVNTAAVGPTLGTYTLTLPAGTYDFYVRSFGYAPVEVRNVSVQANGTQNFTVNTSVSTASPAYLTAASVAPQTVFISTPGSTSTYTLSSTTNLGPTVALFNEFGSFSVDGVTAGTIDLYDDGTHGDAVAGDRTYSRSGIGFDGVASYRCSRFASAEFLYARVSTPAAALVHVPSSSLIGVAGAAVPTTVLDSKTQYSTYAANIVADSRDSLRKEQAKQFYEHFADVYDFLVFVPEKGITAAGFNARVRNDVRGIGVDVFDDSPQYGSAGVLRAIVLIDLSAEPPLLHELIHTWANAINPPFDATYLGHWGYSGVNGILGGFDPAKLVANSDGTFSVDQVFTNGTANDVGKYAPLELYLAGLAPLSAVPTVPVFTNVQMVNGSSTRFRGTRADISGADIVARHGARVPSFAAAQKSFRIAFVGVTSKPMNAAGMAYLSQLAQQVSGATSNCFTAVSFATATGGAGSLDATIRVRGATTRRRAARR